MSYLSEGEREPEGAILGHGDSLVEFSQRRTGGLSPTADRQLRCGGQATAVLMSSSAGGATRNCRNGPDRLFDGTPHTLGRHRHTRSWPFHSCADPLAGDRRLSATEIWTQSWSRNWASARSMRNPGSPLITPFVCFSVSPS